MIRKMKKHKNQIERLMARVESEGMTYCTMILLAAMGGFLPLIQGGRSLALTASRCGVLTALGAQEGKRAPARCGRRGVWAVVSL